VATAAAAGFQRQIKVMIELEPGTNNIPKIHRKQEGRRPRFWREEKPCEPNAETVRKFLVKGV
jgi:hypothetical protein